MIFQNIGILWKTYKRYFFINLQKLKQKDIELDDAQANYKKQILDYKNKLEQYKQKMTLLMNQKGGNSVDQKDRKRSSNKNASNVNSTHT